MVIEKEQQQEEITLKITEIKGFPKEIESSKSNKNLIHYTVLAYLMMVMIMIIVMCW